MNGDDSYSYYLLRNGTFRPFDINSVEEMNNIAPYVTDPAYIESIFLTENGGDLVENVTNKVYFYLYDESPEWFMNLTNVAVRAYDTYANNTPIREIAKGINSLYNGLGSFSYAHKPGYLPFLEFVLPDFKLFQNLPGNHSFPTEL